jgi:hypothetical protein
MFEQTFKNIDDDMFLVRGQNSDMDPVGRNSNVL